ncbi:hypothetical protein [Vibrio sp.]|uniref:hypothetical protein n=1 Tax=Vibrio sp. TaxID=678 RepID=UPI00311FD17F
MIRKIKSIIAVSVVSSFILNSVCLASSPPNESEIKELSITIDNGDGAIYANGNMQLEVSVNYELLEGANVASIELLTPNSDLRSDPILGPILFPSSPPIPNQGVITIHDSVLGTISLPMSESFPESISDPNSKEYIPIGWSGLFYDVLPNTYLKTVMAGRNRRSATMPVNSLRNRQMSSKKLYIRTKEPQNKEICVRLTTESGDSRSTCDKRGSNSYITLRAIEPLGWSARDFVNSIYWDFEEHSSSDDLTGINNTPDYQPNSGRDINNGGLRIKTLKLLPGLPRIVSYNLVDQDHDFVGYYSSISDEPSMGEQWTSTRIIPKLMGAQNVYFNDAWAHFNTLDPGIHIFSTIFPRGSYFHESWPMSLMNSSQPVRVEFIDAYGNVNVIGIIQDDADNTPYVVDF